MFAFPGDGAAETFLIPKLAMSPIKAEAVLEYASVYPQNIHWNVVTATTIMDWKSSESELLRRARPP